MGNTEHTQRFSVGFHLTCCLLLVSYEFFILLYQADHKPELNCYDSDWVTPSYEHDMRRIRRFYSLSKGFLKIEPKPDTLSCGSPTEIQVHYIFTPEAIGEQKKIVIYYLVRIICAYFDLWPQRAPWPIELRPAVTKHSPALFSQGGKTRFETESRGCGSGI